MQGTDSMRGQTGLYQTIREKLKEQECSLFTVLEGEHIGEKLLWCKEEAVWQSAPDGFLSDKKEMIADTNGSGIIETEGTRIFCERFSTKSRLVICGGGHVSIAVAGLGKKLGFEVTVLEDRPTFANNARRAGADEVICDNFADSMEKIKGSPETYFIIVTRGHRYDTLCLKSALGKPNAYIGMMGSRKRVALVKEKLRNDGIRRDTLEEVHTPIGLDIGAETPEEIAVAIMAEIIGVKNKKQRSFGYPEELLQVLIDTEVRREPSVLAVIVSKQGSAPRKIGTKMLVFRDGRILGTIGGGCTESDVIRKAQLMLDGISEERQIIKLDMTGTDAAEEGMVCGGVVEVYLEKRDEIWRRS